MKKQIETENKGVFPKAEKKKKSKFFFPDHEVTIEAESVEEAEKILNKRK